MGIGIGIGRDMGIGIGIGRDMGIGIGIGRDMGIGIGGIGIGIWAEAYTLQRLTSRLAPLRNDFEDPCTASGLWF